MGSLEQAALQPAAFAAAKPRPGSAQKRRRSSGISAGNAAGAAAALATTASGPLQPGIKLEPGAENAGALPPSVGLLHPAGDLVA